MNVLANISEMFGRKFPFDSGLYLFCILSLCDETIGRLSETTFFTACDAAAVIRRRFG